MAADPSRPKADVGRVFPEARQPDHQGLVGVYGPLRRFGYGDVEKLTEQLAGLLEQQLGREQLRDLRFQAIPRGGLFVLGYLSYFLDLTPEQLRPRNGAPLVLVDDCSISGARFGRCRREHSGSLYFAHLYSPPPLRAAIEREADVLGCFAVRDLHDLAPELYPDPAEYAAWRLRCAEKLGPGRYWIGIPERIAFPWTEPDTVLCNPATGCLEPGWRLAAPDRCLNNRRLLGVPLLADVVRRFRVPDTVAYRLTEDGVELCDLRSEHCYGMRGTAADMWRALAAYGEAEAAAAYVSTLYAIRSDDAVADTRRFAEQLLALQLLEPLAEIG